MPGLLARIDYAAHSVCPSWSSSSAGHNELPPGGGGAWTFAGDCRLSADDSRGMSTRLKCKTFSGALIKIVLHGEINTMIYSKKKPQSFLTAAALNPICQIATVFTRATYCGKFCEKQKNSLIFILTLDKSNPPPASLPRIAIT